jgi:hypothetical protein
MSFCTIGDSHAKYPWCYIPGIEVIHLGPILCHTVGKHKNDLVNGVNISNHGIKPEDTVCFCYGEIDCRCHIHKHVTASRAYQQVIDEIVGDYFVALMENEKLVPGVKMAVFNVIPPARFPGATQNNDYPYRGTNEERVAYSRHFNTAIAWNCKEVGYAFIDVYDKYADEGGCLDTRYSDGHVHINNPVFVIEALKGLL